MCTVLLPPGGYPTADNKCIYTQSACWCCHRTGPVCNT